MLLQNPSMAFLADLIGIDYLPVVFASAVLLIVSIVIFGIARRRNGTDRQAGLIVEGIEAVLSILNPSRLAGRSQTRNKLKMNKRPRKNVSPQFESCFTFFF